MTSENSQTRIPYEHFGRNLARDLGYIPLDPVYLRRPLSETVLERICDDVSSAETQLNDLKRRLTGVSLAEACSTEKCEFTPFNVGGCHYLFRVLLDNIINERVFPIKSLDNIITTLSFYILSTKMV